MTILVSGGAGYIGSHTCVELLNAGYKIIISDNFSNSYPAVLDRIRQITGKDFLFYDANMANQEEVDRIFDEHPEISTVIQFAAFKSVEESFINPLSYSRNNMACTINMLIAMQAHDCNNLVFSSSAAVYGNCATMPVSEDAHIDGQTSPYAASKYFCERIIMDCCAANPKLNAAILRYFNPIGAHPSGLIGEDPKGSPNNLLSNIANVAAGKQEMLHIYGNDYKTSDGTCVRDFIHVVDLARGHLAAIDKLNQSPGLVTYNLGTGRGYTVLEILKAFEGTCGKYLPYSIEPRRPGDVAASWANPVKAMAELGWQAQYGIDDMCRDVCNWLRKNPEGYPK